MKPAWRLSLFGTVGLHSERQSYTAFETRRAAKILVLLSFSRSGKLRRDDLADLLWPDDFIDSTRLRLRQELSRLRRGLADTGDLITASVDVVALDQTQIENDLDRLAHPETLPTDALLDMLSEQFLPGWDDPWVTAKREEVDQLRIKAAVAVASSLLNQQKADLALKVVQAAAPIAPRNEEVRDIAMKAHASLGSLSDALIEFRRFKRNLGSAVNETRTEHEVLTEAARIVEPSKLELPPLPHPIDQFYGREQVAAELRGLVSDRNEVRLISLVGTGGIGKTRLAIEALKDLDLNLGFVSFVECMPDIDPAAYLLQELLHGNTAPDPLGALKRILQGHSCLLVLDNLEHLDDPGKVVTSLLSSISDLRLVVTSRRPMKVAGEQVFALSTLDKVREALPMLAELTGTRKTSGNQSNIYEEIVDLCGGIPLTLRLAAARLRLLEPEELLQELKHSTAPLRADLPDLAERHRNLDRMLQVAMSSLSEADSKTLLAISCFPGGVTRAIVRRMVDDEVDSVLERLLDSALIWLDDENSPLRFRLLEPIRQYLSCSTPVKEYADRQSEFVERMVEIARSFRPGCALPSDDERLLYRRESANFRAAINLALESDPEKALEIFSKIWDWKLASGRSAELLDLTTILLQKTKPSPAYLGHIYNCRAWCYSVSGDLKQTAEVASLAKKHFEEAGLAADACYADALAHECLRHFDDWSKALKRYDELIDTASRVEPYLVATIRVWRGKALAYRSEWDKAAADLEFGYERARERGNISLQITAGSALLFVDYARKDIGRLRHRVEELEVIHAEFDDPYCWSIFFRAVSRFELTQGNFARAEELSRRSIDVFGFAGNAFQEVEARVSLARAQMAQRHFDEAKKTLREIAPFFSKVLPRVQIPALVAVAEYQLSKGDLDSAIKTMSQARAYEESTKAKLVLFEQEYFDSICEKVGNPEAALDLDEERLVQLFELGN